MPLRFFIRFAILLVVRAEQVSEGIENMAGMKEDESAATETVKADWKRVIELSARLQEVTGALKA